MTISEIILIEFFWIWIRIHILTQAGTKNQSKNHSTLFFDWFEKSVTPAWVRKWLRIQLMTKHPPQNCNTSYPSLMCTPLPWRKLRGSLCLEQDGEPCPPSAKYQAFSLDELIPAHDEVKPDDVILVQFARDGIRHTSPLSLISTPLRTSFTRLFCADYNWDDCLNQSPEFDALAARWSHVLHCSWWVPA